MDYFDNRGFNDYYLNYAKATNKNNLLNRFYDAWIDWFGPVNSLPYISKGSVKVLWKKAGTKKGIKDKLLKWGFTASTIDGLFKKFTEWVDKKC